MQGPLLCITDTQFSGSNTANACLQGMLKGIITHMDNLKQPGITDKTILGKIP